METKLTELQELQSKLDHAEKCCAEMRNALGPFFCETCEGKKTYVFECSGCLSGESECTCAQQQPEPCPQCRSCAAISKIYDDREHALSSDCGTNYVPKSEVERLREALRKIADVSQMTAVTFEVQAFTAVDIAIAALKEGQ